jgi:peptidyl-prolyl cis-trans isomerase B (cyclophilin B)
MGCNTDDTNSEETNNANEETSSSKSTFIGNHQIEIEVENYGTIYLDLDGESAPITVDNFIKLAEEGFYDGLTFHRIISGFMIQGGDPLGNGSGGSEDTIKGEFADNGIKNALSNTRGAISMARSNDYDSASSQFFIVHEDSTFLDGSYAVFGYVTDGMDIVDKICSETTVQDNNGTVLQEDQPIIKSIKVIK